MRYQIGIDGIPYQKHPGPGKFYVITGPDLVGKTTLGKYLAKTHHMNFWTYHYGADDVLRRYMHQLLDDGRAVTQPVLFQRIIDSVESQTQEVLQLALDAGTNIIMDRWWPCALVYGQVTGLPLDFLLSDSRFQYVPSAVLVIYRDDRLPGRTEKQNSYDTEHFQKQVRHLYENWLLPWWQRTIPTIPIAMVKLPTGISVEEAEKRTLRRFNALLSECR